MRRNYLLVLAACLLFGGCLWSSKVIKSGQASEPGLSVEVLRPDILVKGGSLILEPFKAGPGAEATPELDRMALSIVKGAVDAMEGGSSRMYYKSPDSSGGADLLVEGHIEKVQAPGFVDGLLFKKEAVFLVKADVRDVASREVVALVFGRRVVPDGSRGFQQAAYDFGRDMVLELNK
ncbi:MAG: hypothetical protein HGA80_00320 [Candidatus Omnitrophica bacterium]|nr:hypothetical protein [Candidatus Omnitrophota bacterium]